MTFRQELELMANEDRVPVQYYLTKRAEDVIYHYSNEFNCEEDRALDLILLYMGCTDNINKFLNDLDLKFNPQNWR